MRTLGLPRAEMRAPGWAAGSSAPVLLWGVVAAAALAGLAVGLTAPRIGVEASLVPLLRFMAVLKAGMALGAALLVQWRLRRPAGGALQAALIGATGMMAAAPGLIWGLAHLIAGAVLFHAGLLLFLVAAARDGFGLTARARNT